MFIALGDEDDEGKKQVTQDTRPFLFKSSNLHIVRLKKIFFLKLSSPGYLLKNLWQIQIRITFTNDKRNEHAVGAWTYLCSTHCRHNHHQVVKVPTNNTG